MSETTQRWSSFRYAPTVAMSIGGHVIGVFMHKQWLVRPAARAYGATQ
jgi:hypothetical protein